MDSSCRRSHPGQHVRGVPPTRAPDQRTTSESPCSPTTWAWTEWGATWRARPSTWRSRAVSSIVPVPSTRAGVVQEHLVRGPGVERGDSHTGPDPPGTDDGNPSSHETLGQRTWHRPTNDKDKWAQAPYFWRPLPWHAIAGGSPCLRGYAQA